LVLFRDWGWKILAIFFKPVSFLYIKFSTVRNQYYAIKMIQIDIYRNNTGLILYRKISNRNFSIFIILYSIFNIFKIISIRYISISILTLSSISTMSGNWCFSFKTFLKQMDKLKLTGQNLGRVFNCRCGHACVCHTIMLWTKTA